MAIESPACLKNKITLTLQPASSFKITHQGPLDRCINNASSFAGINQFNFSCLDEKIIYLLIFFFHYSSASGWKHNEITTGLLRMIAVDNMPLSTPERAGFKMFVKKQILTTAMSHKYNELSNKIKIELQQTDSVCLTRYLDTPSYYEKFEISV